jgi:alkanesulfonate monooxygenase SsuD/methylene tetrahydromethanopterin reductase-like flavin-dependent oxidoreductase (luciferase family)
MTLFGVQDGTEGASVADAIEFWERVEALGYDWISAWDHFYPVLDQYADVSQAVAYGSDQQVLDAIKAFEEAGADQILNGNCILDGTDDIERVAGLLRLTARNVDR